MHAREIRDRLIVCPMIEPEEQVGHGSVDVRLGTEFIVPRTTSFSEINPMALLDKHERLQERELRLGIGEFEERFYVRIGDSMVVHPGQLVLGSTLEYVRFPSDLMGQVLGRSSWGRMGLTIATATLVRSAVPGVVTLEIANVGNTPIRLFPGVRIAQLTIEKVEAPSGQATDHAGVSKYSYSTRPDISRVYEDPDLRRIYGVVERLREQRQLSRTPPARRPVQGGKAP